ncbi:MAG: hypothetical protein ACRYGP_24170 [Janthinobacterium lividum]
MRRWLSNLILIGLCIAVPVTGVQAQTPGGQTGGTSGGTGSASSNGGQGDAGGTGQTGVKTLGSGKVVTTPPAVGSSTGGVSGSSVVGSGANGNGGVATGKTP